MELAIDKKESWALKGFAIITVMLSHSADMGCLYINRDIFAYFCRGGMAIFLFLSGYGCFASYLECGLNEYWDKKFIKIWFPFFICQITLYFLSFIINNTRFTLGEYISLLLALCREPMVDGSMWYINFIFLWYFLFYFIFRLFDIRKALIALVFLTIFAYIYIPVYYPHGGYLSIQFCCGILYRWTIECSCFDRLKIYKMCKFIPVISLPVYFIISMMTYNKSTCLAQIVSVFSTIIFIISILIVVKSVKHIEIFEKLGEKSYYIYLVEAVVIYDVLNINYVYYIFGKNLLSVFINLILIFILARILEVGINKFESVSGINNGVIKERKS